ncbi:unnamed protein product [Parnassius mnemosyne]|uniref:Carboxylic ester hydrolase n=1 Tax=Parnassius mnemosyne TaxID=213953 RepID=A0AAV1M7Y4_9NEOP
MFLISSKFAIQVPAVFKHFAKNTSTAITMSSPTVTIKQGKLVGSVKKLNDGSPYYSFKGIPYAQPPVGKLRFMAPQPPKPWNGTYKAIEHGPVCPQVDIITGQFQEGSEDCLFLNVYTKSLVRDSKMPVMVFFHGGAYMSGSGDTSMYGPEFLIQHNVILVTINYRLEVLGYLCLDSPEVPGNAGMKDQVAALRWVQSNIEQFGGDPDNVTIFGESAGAAAVTFHMFSPMSTGLFHKAIAQSGVCISDWAQGKNGKERAIRAAKFLGKDSENSNELLHFFQNTTVDKLVKLTFKTMTYDEKHRGLPIHFAPVVEKQFQNTEAFLTEEPMKLLLAGKINKVPFIVGYNSAEGLTVAKNQVKKLDFLNKNPSFFVPREIAEKVAVNILTDFGNRIKRFYAGNRDITENDIDILSDINSDMHFVYNCHRFCHFYANLFKSIYFYRFDCVTDLNIFKQMLGYTDYKGASHVDELFYLFNNAMNKDCYEEQEKLRVLINTITKLWADFAKTSNPTPDSTKWLPYTVNGREFMSINEEMSMSTYAERERIEFWNKLYKESGLPYITKSSL